jgi:hypothetical protein
LKTSTQKRNRKSHHGRNVRRRGRGDYNMWLRPKPHFILCLETKNEARKSGTKPCPP